jgi:putative nucleotidyltransferase with HDIG domain
LLTAQQLALFHTMSHRDRVHSAATAALLARQQGVTSPLLTAALLHDCGKGKQAILQRVLYVVLAATSPALVARLAKRGGGTRGALYRSLHHPALGATLAARAGCSEHVCRLIAAHHQPKDGESDALRQADEVA